MVVFLGRCGLVFTHQQQAKSRILPKMAWWTNKFIEVTYKSNGDSKS